MAPGNLTQPVTSINDRPYPSRRHEFARDGQVLTEVTSTSSPCCHKCLEITRAPCAHVVRVRPFLCLGGQVVHTQEAHDNYGGDSLVLSCAIRMDETHSFRGCSLEGCLMNEAGVGNKLLTR